MNTASDFLSRPELKVTEKIRLKIRKDIQTTPVEVTTSSSDVTHEEQIFFRQVENENESREQISEQRELTWQNAKHWVANEEPSSLNTSVKEFTKIDGNTTSISLNKIKAIAQIRVGKDVDRARKT